MMARVENGPVRELPGTGAAKGERQGQRVEKTNRAKLHTLQGRGHTVSVSCDSRIFAA